MFWHHVQFSICVTVRHLQLKYKRGWTINIYKTNFFILYKRHFIICANMTYNRLVILFCLLPGNAIKACKLNNFRTVSAQRHKNGRCCNFLWRCAK